MQQRVADSEAASGKSRLPQPSTRGLRRSPMAHSESIHREASITLESLSQLDRAIFSRSEHVNSDGLTILSDGISPQSARHDGPTAQLSVRLEHSPFQPLASNDLRPVMDEYASAARHEPVELREADPSGILPSPTRFNSSSLYSTRHPLHERPRYDMPPAVPLSVFVRTMLEFTELPFMILWVFFAYWVVILCISAKYTTTQMWLSAVFAGLLVGLALNANAYKYIVKPKTRSRSLANATASYESESIHHHMVRHVGLSPIPSNNDGRHPFHSSYETDIQAYKPEGDIHGVTNGTVSGERSHLMKLVVRFPRFFNQLVTTKRDCVRRDNAMHRLENQTTHDGGGTIYSLPQPIPPTPTHHYAFNAFSSGMNSLTKLARDWSIFSDTLEWELDIPTMIRFFIIPFAVSALSGMTSDEEKYILVFPKHPILVTIACCVPAVWVSLLSLSRLLLLYHINVIWRWKVVFFNGCLIH